MPFMVPQGVTEHCVASWQRSSGARLLLKLQKALGFGAWRQVRRLNQVNRLGFP